jgi:WD40 repeat protein
VLPGLVAERKTIAFDSLAEDGTWHVWTIDVEGAAPQRITKEPGDQIRPTWSHDGDWIYFTWQQGSGSDIWRTRGPDGPSEQVTFTGTMSRAWESFDRSGVFYKRQASSLNAPLDFQPLAGGVPHALSACVSGHGFSVGKRGIYYVPCQPHDAGDVDVTLRILNPATGEDRLLPRSRTSRIVLWEAAWAGLSSRPMARRFSTTGSSPVLPT